MTLDEWKAMQDKERTKVEFNIRKPNEGTDSQWKKGYVLHKSKSEDVSTGISVVNRELGCMYECVLEHPEFGGRRLDIYGGFSSLPPISSSSWP